MDNQNDIRQVLWQLAFQFKVSTKRAVRQYDLPLNGMHVRLLQIIHGHPDCTAQRIAAVTGRDKAQITRVVKELESMALITRTPDPSDRRSQLLVLNDQGQSLMARIKEAENDVKKRFLKASIKKIRTPSSSSVIGCWITSATPSPGDEARFVGAGFVGAGLPAKGRQSRPAGFQRGCLCVCWIGLWDPAGSFAPFRGQARSHKARSHRAGLLPQGR